MYDLGSLSLKFFEFKVERFGLNKPLFLVEVFGLGTKILRIISRNMFLTCYGSSNILKTWNSPENFSLEMK